MRKILLFLVLFGAGLSVLLLFVQRGEKQEKTPEPMPVPSPGSFTEIPGNAGPKDGTQGKIGVQLGGELDFTVRSGADPSLQKPLYHVSADVTALGGEIYDARGLSVEVYNQDTRAVKFKMTSPLTRLHIPLVEGRPSLAQGETVQLSTVDLTMNEGAPIVPLTLQVPLLLWHITENDLADRFESNDRVQIDGGRSFHAEGTGFEVKRGDAAEGDQIVLRQDGMLRLVLEQGGEATLSSTGTGPIVVKRTTERGEDLLDMLTTEGARFEVKGEEPLVLTANELHLFGRGGVEGLRDFRLVRVQARENVVATSRGDTFRARHAEFTFGAKDRLELVALDGAVALESSGDVFHGDEARFDFDPTGKLFRATLTGSPNGRVQLGKYLPREPSGAAGSIQRELQEAIADISGAGPLVLEFDRPNAPGTSVDLAGPGKLELASLDFSIAAGGKLVGVVDANKQGGRLEARGGVDAHYRDAELTTETLEVRYAIPAPGEEAVVATAAGPTTIEGAPPGRTDVTKITLHADEGLEARASKGRLSIPIARRVSIEAQGPRGFSARADRVVDLDWDTKTFVAEGAVTFSNPQGDGNAERVVTRGERTLELYGTREDPARWQLARRTTAKGALEAETKALEITAQEDELHARGNVVADLVAGVERYHVESAAVDLTLDPPADPAKPDDRAYHARAEGDVRAEFLTQGKKGVLRCRRITVDGDAHVATGGERSGEPARFGDSDVVAEGDVQVDWRGEGGIAGEGDRFTLNRKREGRLEASEGKRIRAVGTMGKRGQPYAMTAKWIEFDETHVEAEDVRVGVAPESLAFASVVLGPTSLLLGEKLELPPGFLESGGASVLELSTKHIHADEREIVLTGDAHAKGKTGQGEAWTVDAGNLRIAGSFSREQKLDAGSVEVIEASDGFSAVLADRARAIGRTMRGNSRRVRIEGEPARLEIKERTGAVLESAWIQYDSENLLLSTDKGTLTPEIKPGEEPWSVTYESLQPFARGENTILVLRNPLFRQGENQVRSLWALFWVDRDEWRKRGEKVMQQGGKSPGLRETAPEAATPVAKKPGRREEKTISERFADLRREPIAQVLSELYLEGNIELTKAGERRARAASMYLDLKEGRGWAQDADVIYPLEIRGKLQRFRAKAQWLSIGPDLSLRADRAVITSCEYDDPHYVIETRDLRLRPPREGKSWSVSAKENALRFGGGWAIPLPPLIAGADENGYPFIGDVNFGNTARFGTALRGSFNVPLGGIGKGIGGLFDKFLDLPQVDVPDGRWKLDAGYLGSRGILLGTGLEFTRRDEAGRRVFHLDSSIDGIPDRRRDRGLIRVDPDDRSLLRTWFRARGRWAPEENRWWDLALSKQSDPGVQSEFFERDFFEYEQKDNYLHFRSSWDDWYAYGSAKTLFENRTDVEELPYGGIVRGRTPIGHLGDLGLYYTGQLNAGYLRRKTGDPRYYPPFPDLLGSRDVVRADTTQRLEAPFDLGWAAIRATPFVEGRFTAWDRGVDEQDSPTRAGATAGVEFGTTLWKAYGNGSIHALAPTLSVHGDLGVEHQGGDPVRFDHVEDPIEGRFVELGVRSRWWKPLSKERFDVEVRSAYATDLEAGQREGFQPISVLSEFLTFAGNVPVGFTHDGRYDTRTNLTDYSRTFIGIEPVHDWGLELGYHLGRDDAGDLLYEAATLATRYRATPKWELEAEQSYSFSDSRGLGNTFLLRRIGHDFVMETEIGYRAGEGASFNVNLKPLFAWKRSSLGLIDRWLGVYH